MSTSLTSLINQHDDIAQGEILIAMFIAEHHVAIRAFRHTRKGINRRIVLAILMVLIIKTLPNVFLDVEFVVLQTSKKALIQLRTSDYSQPFWLKWHALLMPHMLMHTCSFT